MRARWFFASLVAAQAVTAQSPSPRIGLSAGLNQAHVSGEDVSDISNRSGGAFGAYLVAPLGQSGWAFQTGAVYTMKGWERDEPGTRDLAVVKLNYFELPALLRYDFARQSSVGGLLFFGPGFGFRTGCSLEATQGSTGRTSKASCADVEAQSNGSLGFKSFDLGGIIGGGLRVGVASREFVITAQYEHGFTSVENDHDVKSRTLSFGVGLELPILRR